MLFLLGSLTALILGLFIYWIFNRDTQATYVASVSFQNYRENLPSIPAWNPTALIEAANSYERRPFIDIAAPETLFENKTNVEPNLSSLKPTLPNKDYPLVVQLRCHAAARLGPSGQDKQEGLRCELLINKTTADEDRYFLETFLEKLSDFPASNIIVLADIADISFLPSEGILANLIESSIHATCQRIADKVKVKNRELWIIIPTSDGQVSLRDRSGRTLFQGACEDAFQSQENPISLYDFYRNILCYCHSASEGAQTPLLFRVSDSRAPVDVNQPLAKQVRLSIRETSSTTKSKEAKGTEKLEPSPKPNAPKSEANVDSSFPKSKRVERFVSNNVQDPARAKIDQSAGAEVLQTSNQRKEPTSVWQLRDQWATSYSTPGVWTWTASEYSAAEWRNELLCEARKDLFASSQTRFIPWNKAVNQETQSPLEVLKSFVDLKEKIFWTNSDLLPSHLREEWNAIRPRYREYIHSVSELLFWRDLFMDLPSAGNSTSLDEKALNSMFDQLQVMRQKLPASDDENAIDTWNQSRTAIPQDKPISLLRDQLEKLVAAVEKKNNSWNWADEHRCHTLLSSPLLTEAQRTRLEKSRPKDPKKNIETVRFSSDQDLAEMIRGARNIGLLKTKKDLFLKCAETCSKLYLVPLPILKESSADADDQGVLVLAKRFLNHQDELTAKLGNAVYANEKNALSHKINRWHVYHLAEMRSELLKIAKDDAPGNHGIVVFPTNHKAIVVRPPSPTYVDLSESSESASFLLSVGYLAFDEPLTECDLVWNSDPPNFNGRLFVNGKEWPRNDKTTIKVVDKSVRVQLSVPGEGMRIPLNTKLFIHVADQDRPLAIPVLQRANALELVVSEKSLATNWQPQHTDDAIHLFGPIFKGAQATFEFALRNKQPKKRFAILKIYTENETSQLIAQSDLLELPEGSFSGIQPSIQVPVSPIKGKSETNPIASLVRTLRYEIEEFESPLLKSEASAPNPTTTGAIPSKRINQFSGKLLLEHWNPRDAVIVKPATKVELGDAARLILTLQDAPYVPGELDIHVIGIQGSSFTATKTFKTDIGKLEVELPRLDANTNLLLGVDLGGYPRAHFFELNANNNPAFSEVFFQSIEVSSLTPIFSESLPTPKEPKPTQPTRKIFFPNWLETPNGRAKTRCTGLRVQGKFDTSPNSDIQWSIRRKNSLAGELLFSGTWQDRNYTPVTSFDGSMKLHFEVGEVDRIIDLTNIASDTSELLELAFKAGNKESRWELLFDRQDPNPKGKWQHLDAGRVRDVVNLYEDSNIDVEFLTQDDPNGSGLRSGKVSRSGQSSGRYNENDPLDWKCSHFDEGNRIGSRFAVNLKSFVDLPKGDYWIHVATIDGAGNQQVDHPPLKVIWNRSPSPKPAKTP
ncbi:MAG: hypothetical protein ABL921_24570 [Pirellula sp.]